jgi:hypothetical protein
MALTFVCFKWKKPKKGFVLPAAISAYTAEHVNILWRMLYRHYHKPFRLVCVTDDPRGVDCETVPLWDKHLTLGGCFNRLYTFSPDMKDLFGERFVCIDLDCVVTGDITEVFNKRADFVMNSYNPLPDRVSPDQRYNGALYMMDAGCRKEVWETFDPIESVRAVQNNPRVCIGSDQAWIRLCLGREEARFTNSDGVYEVRQFNDKLPADARLVFFAGARDPSQLRFDWVKEHWK